MSDVVQIRKHKCPARATYTAWYFCEHCENIHLSLRDADDNVYTEATMSDAMLLGAVAALLARRGIKEVPK